ncbi:hypothetical protein [Marinicella meishanensis]|uniref:hypothetical protein n=1 Tax=Marinicella meishanensis TaxID=2873263 RepID=UPI001CBC3679|nr:hypothetical protein [Marinicella sp. NBU2979]
MNVKIERVLTSEKTQTALVVCAVVLFFTPLLISLVGLIPNEYEFPRELANVLLNSAQLSIVIFFILAIMANIRLKNTDVASISNTIPSFFQSGSEFENLDIRCLNSRQFIDQIKNADVKIDKLRIIMSSLESVQTFYCGHLKDSQNKTGLVTCEKFAHKEIKKNRETAEKQIKGLMKQNKIASCEIYEIDSFCLDFFCVLNNGKKAMVGRYSPDISREDLIGLSSRCWLEDLPARKNELAKDFNLLWTSLSKHNAAKKVTTD